MDKLCAWCDSPANGTSIWQGDGMTWNSCGEHGFDFQSEDRNMVTLECSGCSTVIASFDEEAHTRLSAMQGHDRECKYHSLEGCSHPGYCYV